MPIQVTNIHYGRRDLVGTVYTRRGEGNIFVVVEGVLSGVTFATVRQRAAECVQRRGEDYSKIDVVQKGTQVAFVIEGDRLNVVGPPTEEEVRRFLRSPAGLLWPLAYLQCKAQYYLKVSPVHLLYRRAKKLVEELCQ